MTLVNETRSAGVARRSRVGGSESYGPRTNQSSRNALQLLDRAGGELLKSVHAVTAAERFVHAHLAALRSASAIVAVRRPRFRRAPLSVWELLKIADPEFSAWSEYFASGAITRAAIEAGRTEIVTQAQSNDLLREAERFLSITRTSLDPDLGGLAVANFSNISA